MGLLAQALAGTTAAGIDDDFVTKEQKRLVKAQNEIERYQNVFVRLQEAHSESRYPRTSLSLIVSRYALLYLPAPLCYSVN